MIIDLAPGPDPDRITPCEIRGSERDFAAVDPADPADGADMRVVLDQRNEMLLGLGRDACSEFSSLRTKPISELGPYLGPGRGILSVFIGVCGSVRSEKTA